MPLVKPRLPVLQPRHPLTRGLVGAWLFTERGGLTVRDVTCRGSATLTNMDTATDWVVGPYGYALDFDGSNDHLVASAGRAWDLVSGQAVSVASLVKIRSFQAVAPNIREIASLSGTGNDQYTLRLGNSGVQDKFNWAVDTTGTDISVLSNVVSLDTYYWALGTFDAGAAAIYVDGVQHNTASGGTTMIAQAGNNLYVGARAGTTRFYDGEIAAVLIWKRGLRQIEAARYLHPARGPWSMFAPTYDAVGMVPSAIQVAAVYRALMRTPGIPTRWR